MKFGKQLICFAFMFLLSLSLVSAGFEADSDVESSDTYTLFNAGGAPQCVIDGTSVSWISFDEDGNELGPIDAMDDCYRENGIVGESGPSYPNCCPTGFDCVPSEESEDVRVCVPDNILIDSCEDYETQEKCEGFNIQNIEESVYDYIANALSIDVDEVEGICSDEDAEPYEFEDSGETWLFGGPCKCVWDAEEEECYTSYGLSPFDNPEPESYFDCEIRTGEIEDLCDTEGISKIEWTANVVEYNLDGTVLDDNSDEEIGGCESGYFEKQCPETEAGLPFFTMFNLIITGLAIVGVYFVWSKKRK